MKRIQESYSSIQYENHNPIFINGNNHFRTIAETEGWSGDGTPQNPFIIEGLLITGSSSSLAENLLEITNTNVSFTIQNCLIDSRLQNDYYGYDDGIYVTYSSNALISNNQILNCGRGITLHGDKKCNVTGNILTTNEESAVHLSSCWDNIYIANNIMKNNNVMRKDDEHDEPFITTYPGTLYCQSIGACIITNNSISDNIGWGIKSEYTMRYCTITNNIIQNNSFDGISCSGAIGCTISDNIFINNSRWGIYVTDKSHKNTITFNDFLGNSAEGSKYCDCGYCQYCYRQAFCINSTNVFAFNYWNDWTGPDANVWNLSDKDGIVNWPYPIDTPPEDQYDQYDPYPLVTPSPPQTHLLMSPKIWRPRDNASFPNNYWAYITYRVPVYWTPAIDSYRYSINYSVFLSADNGKTWQLIKSGITGTCWYIDPGNLSNNQLHRIKVVAMSTGGLTSEDVNEGIFTWYEPDPDKNLVETLLTLLPWGIIISLGVGMGVGIILGGKGLYQYLISCLYQILKKDSK